ncbi:MAG: T9SS type A sorting domain-containing protein, partial [Bacteroidota bacterium]|nr:T9SS type A sorting domain-containing protein [Bacteroidota bacterium]
MLDVSDPWNWSIGGLITGVVEIDSKVPEKFSVSQNYPNPFNPSTSIRYSLPASSNVKLIVFDITGNKVAELVNSDQAPGTYEATWNGRNDMGLDVSSGVYFYRLKCGNFTETKKLLLMK